MTAQPALSPTAVPPPGDVPAMTPDQQATIIRAAELIVAADGVRTLAELLQVTNTAPLTEAEVTEYTHDWGMERILSRFGTSARRGGRSVSNPSTSVR